MEPHKAAVRCMKGPKICGDGLDMQGDILLSASFATENALQVSLSIPTENIPCLTLGLNGSFSVQCLKIVIFIKCSH